LKDKPNAQKETIDEIRAEEEEAIDNDISPAQAMEENSPEKKV
jgi:hypothetical protein